MYEQLKVEYNKACRRVDLLIYHGQIISNVGLQSVRENVGRLISLNSFTSTTINKHIAEIFSTSQKYIRRWSCPLSYKSQ